MATLAEITQLNPDLLQEKFELEPRISYDPDRQENLLFLSPLVLLEDLELREGGFKDRGAKEVLSLVAKHICESKDSSLFQVPEIIYFYMGYGKKSENKKCQMAVDREEAEVWLGFLNLSRFSREEDAPAEGEEVEESTNSAEEETPMEIDFEFPTPRDTQALDFEDLDPEDLINPSDSGLQIPLKGSYMLLFSILLIFFDKKLKKAANSTDDEPKIGANKISDFLLFWILPYLLNYTHRKLREIVKHHKEVNKRDFNKIVKKSTLEIIRDALTSCEVSSELRHTIITKYKDFYGTEQLDYEYNLLVTENGSPIILVPKRYKVTQMPARLQDIGSRWRELGDVKLLDKFISKLVKNKEVQRDFLYSLPLLKHRQGVDYAILLPDEKTLEELIGQLEARSAEYFSPPKVVSRGGRNLITPRIALVTSTEKHLAVCFSCFQGKSGQKVAALFRAIGAHYLDHFTLVILRGLCLNPRDKQCKVGSLYPVGSARKVLFKGNRPKKEEEKKSKRKKQVKDFSEGQGRFCEIEFPETYKSWEEEIENDSMIKELISRTKDNLKVCPAFNHDSPLIVAYSTPGCAKKLRGNVPLGATFAQTEKRLEKYEVRAVNLDGCLLSMIARSGRKNNIGVVLAIEDICGKVGSCLPHLAEAIRNIVVNYVRAVIVAGLPKVHPSVPDDEDRDEIETDSSEEDDDESSDDDDEDEDDNNHDEEPAASGLTSSGDSGFGASSSSSETAARVKDGTPTEKELQRLACRIANWEPLGRQLKFNEARLVAFKKENPEVSEQAYKMLLKWKERDGKAATYRVLFNALVYETVSRRDLAEEFCYK